MSYYLWLVLFIHPTYASTDQNPSPGAYILQYERDRVVAQTEEDRVRQEEIDKRNTEALAATKGRHGLS